ncbi:MAG: GntR family transcriptional regulator [Enterocloster asparagiformis]|nr:GntR family transcriptional regulator [Enterocloster asparagiformis]
MTTGKQPIMTIKGQVYQIIKNDICNGVFPPGYWLQEPELARRLGVSRSPVREALRQLVDEGLAVDFPNKGVFVKSFTINDIDEIYDVRSMLESYSIRHSSKKMNPETVQRLNDMIQCLTDLYESGDINAYIEEDTKLHQLIVSLSGNSLVIDIYNRIYTPIQQFRIYSLTSEERFADSVSEHKSVIDHIISGNLEEAVHINQMHLTLAKEGVIQHITQNQEENTGA